MTNDSSITIFILQKNQCKASEMKTSIYGIEIKETQNENIALFPGKNDNELTLVWNTGSSKKITVDNRKLEINTNCILFISQFYMKIELDLVSARIITFNKDFLSPISSLNTVGEFLALFYGAHSISNIPKITLRDHEIETFETSWETLMGEQSNINNPITEALLRNSVSRILLLSQKNHLETEFDIPIDFRDLKRVREFQYLVNNHFKELTKVSGYAQIMKISAKSISEIFKSCYDKKASELIADRRNLYARRQLKFTDELVKNITYDLNFSDSQTFSHFFKKQNRMTPEEFRKLD